MKRKIDLVEEEHESEHEESESSGDQSEDEEPRIKYSISKPIYHFFQYHFPFHGSDHIRHG